MHQFGYDKFLVIVKSIRPSKFQKIKKKSTALIYKKYFIRILLPSPNKDLPMPAPLQQILEEELSLPKDY